MLYVTFTASEAMYDEGGSLEGSDQKDSLDLGPFEWVQLTYEYLRVGPEGDHIATLVDGVWVLGFDTTPNGDWTTYTPAADGMRFSDATIRDNDAN